MSPKIILTAAILLTGLTTSAQSRQELLKKLNQAVNGELKKVASEKNVHTEWTLAEDDRLTVTLIDDNTKAARQEVFNVRDLCGRESCTMIDVLPSFPDATKKITYLNFRPRTGPTLSVVLSDKAAAATIKKLVFQLVASYR